LTSIKCRHTPNAYLIEKAVEAKGGRNKVDKKMSCPIKLITFWNLIEILLFLFFKT
jgi:hypothetical protein